MFSKRIFKNPLTNKIEFHNPDIEDILLDKDLSQTIRAEADILYNKILSNGADWFKKIINYALFNESPPEKYLELNSVNQINHNAANFLESCGKKFMGYFKKETPGQGFPTIEELKNILIQSVDKFIGSNELNKDRRYAGHFQRSIENFIRWKAFGDQPSDVNSILDKLVPFLVKNCKILAYQQLLSRFLCDFNGNFTTEATYSIIIKMLYRSYEAVNYAIKMRGKSENNQPIESHTSHFRIDQQPLNLISEIKKSSIPLPTVSFVNNDITPDPAKFSVDFSLLDSSVKANLVESGWETVETAEIESYLLIMSIRTSVIDQVEIINHFRDDDQSNFCLIQSLFYSGVFSSPTSLVSMESFRLLEMIFNENEVLDLDPWNILESEKARNIPFYANYADAMAYDAAHPTYKMVNGLPIFWNHRYNAGRYKKLANEGDVDVSDYFDNSTKRVRTREEGETALEILQPCLIAEAPISSTLLNFASRIFINILKKRRKLIEKNDEMAIDDGRNLMLFLDGIVVDFFRHHFAFCGENNGVATLPSIYESILPLPSIFYQEYIASNEDSITSNIRPVLNGFLLDFFLRWLDPEKNALFQINQSNCQTSLSHCDEICAIDKYVYRIMRFSEKLSLSPINEDVIFNCVYSNLYETGGHEVDFVKDLLIID